MDRMGFHKLQLNKSLCHLPIDGVFWVYWLLYGVRIRKLHCWVLGRIWVRWGWICRARGRCFNLSFCLCHFLFHYTLFFPVFFSLISLEIRYFDDPSLQEREKTSLTKPPLGSNLYSTFITPWSDSSAAHLVEPDFHLPACYNVQPAALTPNKAAAFSDETLFFMFYAHPRDMLQEVAAQEL
jgi:hypothetical protein